MSDITSVRWMNALSAVIHGYMEKSKVNSQGREPGAEPAGVRTHPEAKQGIWALTSQIISC